ncbi:MAG: aminotransferase class III-fold pyridoxal phosphate-dependent enzyme [Deltaproteobacteria bacterium]|nr:aminotransferase class III-fold pyridoxal phosphate-dependent enzyme [Deltaproteobacteria bacterium]
MDMSTGFSHGFSGEFRDEFSKLNEAIHAESGVRELYAEYSKPAVARLLKLLKLDVVFTRAKGKNLFYRGDHGAEIAVIDMLGGYGSTILGHNHSGLKRVLQAALDQDAPVQAQASIRPGAALLAAKLNVLFWREFPGGTREKFQVHLLSTGTEATEAAIKHALMEWREKQAMFVLQLEKSRNKLIASGAGEAALTAYESAIDAIRASAPTLVALDGSFHGKTAGSLSATANPKYSEMYPERAVETIFIPRTANADEIEAALAGRRVVTPGGRSFSRVIGIMVEPVQGEGGVHPLKHEFLQALSSACRAEKVPLIADEIQSGVWRTGRFLACAHAGVEPDYLLLGKSLGGGLVKVSALMVRASRYVERFGVEHTSTFAEDELSSRVALAALEILSSDRGLSARARDFENKVRRHLLEISRKYPGVIRDVRGRGFFMGIEIDPLLDGRAPNVLAALNQSGYVSYLFASFLLHRHGVRVAPTLNQSNTIRLEPSALISEEATLRVMDAIENLALLLSEGRYLDLTAHLWDHSRSQGKNFSGSLLVSRFREKRSSAERALPKAAFLSHTIDVAHFAKLDPMLTAIAARDRAEFLEGFAPLSKGFIYHEQPIEGANGKRVLLQCYGIVADSGFFERCLRTGDRTALNAVSDTVSRAYAAGATHVGLGQYTSIVSDNGLLLKNGAPRNSTVDRAGDRAGHLSGYLTTGNSLTVGLAYEALTKLVRERGKRMSDLRVGVVGAAGNICNVLAQILADEAAALVAAHREPIDRSPKFREAVDRILAGSRMTQDRIETTVDLAKLSACDVVVLGTNSSRQILLPAHLKRGAIVLDISVPSNVHPLVLAERPDVEVFQGGYARLPAGQSLGDDLFPVPDGETYACMAETLTLALLGHGSDYSLGALSKAQVFRILEMAREAGIGLGSLKKISVIGGLGRMAENHA